MMPFLVKSKLLLSLTIIGVLILTGLGFWQLGRLKEKTDFIKSVNYSLNNPPLDFTAKKDNPLYAKIKVKGHFVAGNDIYLYGRRSTQAQKDGYYLLRPFKTEQGEVIIVAHGWFGHTDKNKVIAEVVNSSDVEITGITLPGEKPKLFVPKNDLKNNVWFTLDLQQAEDLSHLKLQPFFLLETDALLPDFLKPISTANLAHIRNDHLEYAVTWFCLAIALTIVYGVYARRESSND